jgi:hypothetical protein
MGMGPVGLGTVHWTVPAGAMVLAMKASFSMTSGVNAKE